MKRPTPFGKYLLLERINVGGMAEVFRAKAFGVEGFERLVAVKRILPNVAEDTEFIRMFIEEAKLSVQLNHANIAQIFDLGVVEGSYYIALEHVHGRDLRGIFDRCRQLGEAMPVAQACFVAMKVCEGLDYAHNKRDQSGRELGLVHRDVSPQNVLVSFEGEVKLIDFGIAKAAGAGAATQAGVLKGKFGYMSPEQVRGEPIDRRSDVFSCGIVLYELLTGERLFVGGSDFSTLEKVRNVEILPPSTYNRRIPDELERIVLKALSKDVDDRYPHAIDLHDELQAFVYTAGEFYSRKDLAGWMKQTFGQEIEDETAKLESYRQLRPSAVEPSAPDPLASRAGTVTGPIARTATGPIPRTTTRSVARPVTGPIPQPGSGPIARTATGAIARPVSGLPPPVTGAIARPVPGATRPPVTGSTPIPVTGAIARPVPGATQPPVTGSTPIPVTGAIARPVPGATQPPVTGSTPIPVTGSIARGGPGSTPTPPATGPIARETPPATGPIARGGSGLTPPPATGSIARGGSRPTPPPMTGPVARTATGPVAWTATGPIARTTTGPIARTTTGPIAARTTVDPVPAIEPPPRLLARSQPIPVMAAPLAPTIAPAVPIIDPPDDADHVQGTLRVAAQLDPSVVGWEDDDVETQIYADQDGDFDRSRGDRPGLPLQPPLPSSPALMLPSDGPGAEDRAAESAPVGLGPGARWDRLEPADAGVGAGYGAGTGEGHAGYAGHGGYGEYAEPAGYAEPVGQAVQNGQTGYAGPAEYAVPPGSPPAEFAVGSNDGPSPVLQVAPGSLDSLDPRSRRESERGAGPLASPRELAVSGRLVSPVTPLDELALDPMASFGARITDRSRRDRRPSLRLVALGGGAIAVLAVFVGVMLSGGKASIPAAAAPPRAVAPPPPPLADPDTGFDLYVIPSGVTQWKLDGESRTDRLPSRIRGIAPGAHTVQIEPLPGFLSQHQQVAVEPGKAPKIEIRLQPIAGITGAFDSAPSGATVSLIVDGKRQSLGLSPATAPLDPRSSYQVVFEKPGYAPVTRPVSFSGNLEEHIAVKLEKAGSGRSNSSAGPDARALHRVNHPVEHPGDRAPAASVVESAGPERTDRSDRAERGERGDGDAKPSPDSAAGARAQGVLVLGSKPPCEIFVDGAATGLRTPQKDIKLPVGRHRITLVNSEFQIRESFAVDIRADAAEKLIKDYSDRLPR